MIRMSSWSRSDLAIRVCAGATWTSVVGFYLVARSVVKLALAIYTVVFCPRLWQITVAAETWKVAFVGGVSTAPELMS